MPDDFTPLPDRRLPLSCSYHASPDSYQLWISAAPAALLAFLFEVRLFRPVPFVLQSSCFLVLPRNKHPIGAV